MKKEEANTFMGWVNKGRGVKVGEKAAYYDEDVIDGMIVTRAMFLKSQTKKLARVYRNPTASCALWAGTLVPRCVADDVWLDLPLRQV